MSWRHLSTGQTAEGALAVLRDLTLRIQQIQTGAAGQDPLTVADAYIRWVERAESRLQPLFTTSSALTFDDERFWRIRELSPSSVRPLPLIMSATANAEHRLREASDQLSHYTSVTSAKDGEVLGVVDTNVFLHYQHFRDLPWNAVFGSPVVRLLVPLIVIDELDDLKTRSQRGVSRRAGSTIRDLRNLELSDSGNQRLVNNSVSIQFVAEPLGHVRSPNNDDEIIRQAAYLNAMSRASLRIVSGDFGMQLRAEQHGVSTVLLPEKYRVERGSDD